MPTHSDSLEIPTKAILYMRVSTGAQAKKDLSIPDQRSQLRKHCDAQGWDVIGEYSDDKTGRDDNRPGFQQMFEVIENGDAQPDVVLVHSTSRFFRNAIEFWLYHRKLEDFGINLVSLTPHSPSNPLISLS